MKTIQYTLQDGIATITFDEPNSPVNTMCLQWQDDLSEATAQVLKDKDAIKGVILASGKSTFFAGADLKAVMRLTPADAPKAYAEVERVKKNFRTLETLGKPVVSCLNGTALGGGWEVALVGHHRVAVDDNKTLFGLPEVTLGLLPGAGGTQRTPRLIGVAPALDIMLSGKPVSAKEALALGLVDQLDPGTDPLAAGLSFANEIVASRAPIRRTRDATKQLRLCFFSRLSVQHNFETHGPGSRRMVTIKGNQNESGTVSVLPSVPAARIAVTGRQTS